ncbi:MAG: hypothetical protein CM1200mP41_39480 [Gammaproteobacteria bacterium]|nr:MAG: hypothetical protein CM1200mP41_39480 [Gammaproteobacteria bacterium]
MSEADIGVIGLAVMGENLVLNMANHGFPVAVYNRTTQRVDDFIEGGQRIRRLSAPITRRNWSIVKTSASRHADGAGRGGRRQGDQ